MAETCGSSFSRWRKRKTAPRPRNIWPPRPPECAEPLQGGLSSSSRARPDVRRTGNGRRSDQRKNSLVDVTQAPWLPPRSDRGIGTGTDVDFRDSACALRLGSLAIRRYPTDLRKLRTRAHRPNARCTTPSSGKAIHRARRCQCNSLRVVSSSWEVARGP